ncbi:hypothetical protein TWF718_007217 [Orbilia javanica]|uniref:Uncharacterized protein n=1 Tax=Orbilia javanica TaxID=47235 RepID=A0AAN8RII6_9PEZI
MASRTLLRRTRPDRLPMQLYRISFPYCSTVIFQHRLNCSTHSTSSSGPLSRDLDMSNPLYRELIKSIKNPFVRDSIHRLVQGTTTFSESLSQDLHGAGNSLYFRVPELPPRMKGHSHDPDGIPLPPNTFRVSSAEELRSILGQILEYRARNFDEEENADYLRDFVDTHLNEFSNRPAEADSVKEKKTDTPTAESKNPQPPPSESKTNDSSDLKPSESFEAYKEKFNKYLKSGSQFVKDRVPSASMASALEAWEQRSKKSGEYLDKGEPSAYAGKPLNIDYEARRKRSERQLHDLGVENPRQRWGHREFLENLSEGRRKKNSDDAAKSIKEDIKMEEERPIPVSALGSDGPLEYGKAGTVSSAYKPGTDSTNPGTTYSKAPQVEDPFLVYKKEIRELKKAVADLAFMIPKALASKSTNTPDRESQISERNENQDVDNIKPTTERITLMDILNGTASSKSENVEKNIETPIVSRPPPSKPKPSEQLVSDVDPSSDVSTSPEPDTRLLDAIATLSEKLARANQRISELETPSTSMPGFQKFTDHMDEVLATQYSDLRDYFEERVLSETRDVAARVASLEKTMQKFLDNQSKDGACIYSTEGAELGEEPKVPVTVKLDEVDKAGLQKVVDAAVKTAVEEVIAGIQENQESLVEAIADKVDDFRNYGDLIEIITREILDSEGVSKRLDVQVKIVVGQVLEMLGKDENGDLQRIVDAAVKEGTKDLEETVKSRLGDVQMKLFGIERVLRGM